MDTKKVCVKQTFARHEADNRYVILFVAQDTHRSIEDSRIVQCNDTSVGARFEMDTHALLGFMLPSEVVADSVYIDS